MIPLTDIERAKHNREMIAKMREAERLGLDKQSHKRISEVRPRDGKHQPPKEKK